MVVYNVTVKVDTSIADQWLEWLLQEHIPDVLSTGCFAEAKVMRMLETDDTEGPTYTTQYFAHSLDDYNRYIDNYSSQMRQKGFDRWGNRFIAFRSVMEVVK